MKVIISLALSVVSLLLLSTFVESQVCQDTSLLVPTISDLHALRSTPWPTMGSFHTMAR